MTNPTKIVVSGDDDLPQIIFSIPGSTALGTLHFIRELIDVIALENLAQKEGCTFKHPLAGAIGAIRIEDAKQL